MACEPADCRRGIDLSPRRGHPRDRTVLIFEGFLRMKRFLPTIVSAAAFALVSASAAGQTPPPTGQSPPPTTPPAAVPAPSTPGPASSEPETVRADRREYTNDLKNAHYMGHV